MLSTPRGKASVACGGDWAQQGTSLCVRLRGRTRDPCWGCCHASSCGSPGHSGGEGSGRKGVRSVAGDGNRARVLPDGSMFQKALSSEEDFSRGPLKQVTLAGAPLKWATPSTFMQVRDGCTGSGTGSD